MPRRAHVGAPLYEVIEDHNVLAFAFSTRPPG
jgi:hypothetical protein